jgi:hypothetical protein
MRQYAMTQIGLTNPSAALVKAMLIGGARSLAPGQYGTGAQRKSPTARPTPPRAGASRTFGNRCPLQPAGLRPRPHRALVYRTDEHLRAHRDPTNSPLDVALAWIDYPATAGASVTW